MVIWGSVLINPPSAVWVLPQARLEELEASQAALQRVTDEKQMLQVRLDQVPGACWLVLGVTGLGCGLHML